MTNQSDLDLLKEIPGYKAILKSVLKSQIQLLIEQLADHTGEESIILTASVHDGALSHLGSNTGKGFLEGRDEIKSQFLGYCLKSHHTKRNDYNASPYHREKTLMPSHSSSKRPRIRQMATPYSLSPSTTHSQITSSTPHARSTLADSNSFSQNSGMNLSMDTADQADSFLDKVSMPDSVHKSHTRTGGQNENSKTIGDRVKHESAEGESENGSIPLVKSEPGSQDENDLEVTGVELGENSLSSENWSQGYGMKDDDGEHSGYNSSEQAQNDGPGPAEPLGGIAFPGLDNFHHDFSSGTKQIGDISPSELKQALYPEGTQMYENNSSIYFAAKSEELERMKTHYNENPLLSPRKRGRPRKHIISPEDVMNEINNFDGINDQNQNQDGVALAPKGRGKVGRPRKELEPLPPGFVRPAGITLGNGYVKCNICGKILKATSMFTHKQAHLGIKNYACEFCGKSFTQKGPLITHRRIHTGEKPYNCKTCGKPFAAQSGLYQHSRRCPKGFNHNMTI